jgi:hypothetical protein
MKNIELSHQLINPKALQQSIGNIVLSVEIGPEFSGLDTPEGIDRTLQVFNADRMLIRGMDSPQLNRTGIDFSNWDKETTEMATPDGTTYASTTLVIPGEKVPYYKPVGFIFDSAQTEVVHVADSDSGSSGGEGDFWANATDLDSIGQLADHIKTEHPAQMNEVNAHIPDEAVRGLFAVNNKTPKIDALVAKHHYEQQAAGRLPIFLYDAHAGELQPWNPSQEEIDGLVAAIPIQRQRTAYADFLNQD